VQLDSTYQYAALAKTTADGKNKIFSANSEPAHTGLVPGDLWFQLDSNKNVTGIQVWNGSVFVDYLVVANEILVAGSVGTVQIANGAVTADQIGANAVTAIKIAAQTITGDKLNVGSVASAIITSGLFKTADSGARVTIDSTGIKAYDVSGNATFQVDATTGNVTSNGGTFTGSVFRSSSEENTGLKINGASIDMYNASHVNTIHLDGSSNLLTGRVRTGLSGNIVDIDPAFDLKGSGGFTSSGSGIRFTDFNFTGGSAPFVAAELQDGSGKRVAGIDLSSGWRDAGSGSSTLTLLQTPGVGGVAQITAWRDARNSSSKHAMLYLSAPNSGSALARLYSPDEVNITATKLTPNAKTALTGSSQLVTAMSQSGQTIKWTTATLLTELGFVVGVTGAQSHSVTLPSADQYAQLAARVDAMDSDVSAINAQLGNDPAPDPMGLDWTPTAVIKSPGAPANAEWSKYHLYQSCVDTDGRRYIPVLSSTGKFQVEITPNPVADAENNAATNISIDFTASPRADGNPTNVTLVESTGKMVNIYNNPIGEYGGAGSTNIKNPTTVTLVANTVYYVAIAAQTMSPGSAGMYNTFRPRITVTPL